MELRGVTWDHLRGYGPLEATAASYRAIAPEVTVVWERRSLQALADFPVDRLAASYDLVMFDNPWTGFVEQAGCLVALDTFLSASEYADLASDSIGPSFASYHWADHLWALPVDGAAQVSARCSTVGNDLPVTWDEVLLLAQECAAESSRRVGMPLIPIDAFCAFASLCASRGEVPFTSPSIAVSDDVGAQALDWLLRFSMLADPRSLAMNPPSMLDEMGATGEICYVPLLFGYSNYSQAGYRQHLVEFGDIPVVARGAAPRGSTLGGVGLGVSSSSAHLGSAVAYAKYVASRDIQRGEYLAAGGQPASAAAWHDAEVNAKTGGFFASTAATLEGAQVRPRHAGFPAFQDACGQIIHDFLIARSSVEQALVDINQAWCRSAGA